MRYMLGKKPVRHDDRTLKLADYAAPSFAVPASVDWTKAVPRWPMLGNDKFGDCVFAGTYHQMQSWLTNDGIPVVPTVTDALDAYQLVTGFNPATGAGDNGTVMLDAMNYWRNTGYPWTLNAADTATHQIDGYAAADHTNRKEVKLGIAEFGGVLIGANMPLAANAQFGAGKHWTPTTGPSGVAGSWGGHCVYAVGYNARNVAVITWGQIQFATWAWFDKYVDEVYAAVAKDWTGADGISPSKVDFAQLRSDIAGIR